MASPLGHAKMQSETTTESKGTFVLILDDGFVLTGASHEKVVFSLIWRREVH